MQTRQIRAQLLSKDPKTSFEAGQSIHALIHELGWSQNRRAGHRWSKPAARPSHVFAKEKEGKCSICGDPQAGYDLVRLGCGHRHCHECLKGNFQSVLNDPASYPARCCSNLVLADTSFVLDDTQVQTLLEIQKTRESSKVVSCFSCQGDIHLSDITIDAAYCIDCHKLTCTSCKKEMHEDLCPEDPETKSLAELVKQEGWTQCPKCNRVINRTAGCTNMICICKAHFCFRCGHSPCNCGPLRYQGNQARSNVNVVFGGALSGASSKKGATFRQRNSYKMLQNYHRAALRNQDNQKLELKAFQQLRLRKVLEREMARRVIELRSKMKELAGAEKAAKAANTNLGQEEQFEGRYHTRRATRAALENKPMSNIWVDPDVNVDPEDSRPVAARTRSSNRA